MVAAILLAACGSVERRPVIEREGASADRAPAAVARPAPPPAAPSSSPRGGGYYKDDGPGDNAPDPATLAAIPDPEPKVEPLHRFANNPYNVFGQDYVPGKAVVPFRQRGLGSWYGRKFHGQRTSSGEPYDMYAMTAAHPTLPIPSYVQVTSVANGRSVVVRVNDRGPFHPGRIIDLSYTAAWKLGYVNAGSTQVDVELITPDQIPVFAAKRRADVKTQLAAAQARAQVQAQTPSQAPFALPAGEASPSAPVVTAVLAAPESPQSAPLPAGSIASAPVTPPSTAPATQAGSQATPSPAIEPLSASLPVDVEARGIFLQLGAFSGRTTAEDFRARIYRELSWLNETIAIQPREGLFRLHLGPYRDRNEAGNMAERIRSALELKPVIVVR